MLGCDWQRVCSLFGVSRYEPTLLRPRSGQGGSDRGKRPGHGSILMRKPPSLMAVAIPTVVTVAAVYIALAFASKLTGKFFGSDESGLSAVRPVDTSKPTPYIERTPPPSPEVVAERVRRELGAASEPSNEPILIMDLEVEPAPLTIEAIPRDQLRTATPTFDLSSRLRLDGESSPKPAQE